MFSKLLPARFRKDVVVVPLVRLTGAIGMSSPLRPGLTLASIGTTLEQAFRVKGAPAVALAVNSPGGSPVQSALIHARIRELAAKHDKRVLVFAEDVAASGGYWLACAGDEIYANRSSILGSIGVVFAGFGFVEAIGKLGIERRVHTAGESKVILDAFQPEKPGDVKRLKSIQTEIHDAFIELVKKHRGDKLKGEDKDLFSGAFWSGKTALELGLIDGLGDMYGVLREKYGDEVRVRPFGPARGWLRRRLGAGVFSGLLVTRLLDASGASGLEHPSLADDVISAVENRALWQRFGL